MWGGVRQMGNGPKDFLEISITFFFYYHLLQSIIYKYSCVAYCAFYYEEEI